MHRLNVRKREELYQAYREASQDSDRENELKDWDIQTCAELRIEMPS